MGVYNTNRLTHMYNRLELNHGRPVLEDIDDTAHHLTRLVSTIIPETPNEQATYRYMILPQKFSHVLHGMPPISSDEPPQLDFVKTYDELVEQWVTSVSYDIPRFTCVMKERVVRGIALDLLLSSLVRISNAPSSNAALQPVETTDEAKPTEEEPMSSQNFPTTLPSSQLPSSQITATQGDTSQGLSETSPKDTTSHSFSGLSAFTTFKQPRPMARNVANLLSHWKTGADPAAYEWQKTSNMLEEEEARRTGGPSLPRRRSRSRKRSQPPTVPETTSMPGTPIALSIRTWGSQPADSLPAPSFPLPSSQPTLDELPMTQMERGMFGAREVKSQKPKKKRRAAGF
jgi:RNA polymerase I-specific transcription initiation factor RRN6